jgi:hypothetical protein
MTACRALVLVVLAMAADAAVAGCGGGRTPRRVPDDGAPCSASMPGAAKNGEKSIRLDAVTVIERSWVLLPDPAADPPEVTTYVIRRGAVPAGSSLRDAALLDAAVARAGRGIALQDGTKPNVAKVTTAAGDAVELRWETGKLHNATRFLLIPGGYCEVTIMAARTEAEVASYLASAQMRADGTH